MGLSLVWRGKAGVDWKENDNNIGFDLVFRTRASIKHS